MWDSAVRWTFGPPSADPETKDTEQVSDTLSSPPPRPTPQHGKRTADAHVSTTPTQHQRRTLPSLLARKRKSEAAHPVVSLPTPSSVAGTAVRTTGDALNPLATTASPGTISSSPLSSPPGSPWTIPSPSAIQPTADSAPSTPAASPPPYSPPTLAPASPPTTTSEIPDSTATQHNPITMAPQPPRYPDPDPVAEAVLAPVRVQLKKLRLTTASAAPSPGMRAYFPRMKSHLQLVRERLEPVGAFIVEEVGKRKDGGGALEMRIWYVDSALHCRGRGRRHRQTQLTPPSVQLPHRQTPLAAPRHPGRSHAPPHPRNVPQRAVQARTVRAPAPVAARAATQRGSTSARRARRLRGRHACPRSHAVIR